MSRQAQGARGSKQNVVLADRYRVHPAKPLPQLDSPMAHAVAASDLRGPGRNMFALTCRPDLLPRIDVIPQLSRLTRLAMVNPVDAGAVEWPETGGRRFVIVFDHTFGDRLVESSQTTMAPMHEDHLVRAVIRSLMPALKELGNRYVTHRAIRPDNAFYADASREAVVLGECVSASPALSQPVVYEPIDSAMARPSARGSGTAADDLYAFGAMLAFLLTGGEAVAGLSEEQIIHGKIVRGSYATLLGDTRVSLSMMEPLRGLLCDDPKERWTALDLELWLGGRQLSPKQPMLPTRAARAITLAGQEHWTKPSLAYAMGRHWREAARIVASGQLEKWVQRALSDDETAEAVKGITRTAGVAAEGEERLTSTTLMVLEPGQPLHYKDVSARIDGLTESFAVEFHNQEYRRTFAELVRAKVPQIYLQSQTSTRPDQVALMKTFDMINFFFDRPQIGAGVERALYESNRGWPCQSPLIVDQYVYELEDLLPALERVAAHSEPAQELVDRHIAAFCAARIETIPERILRELGNPDDLAVFRLGVLRLLAEVQRGSEANRRFPALCQLLARSVLPIVESYHNRAYRQRLSQEIERARSKGDILELLFLVDSLEARNQDTEGFARAQKEYDGHARAIAWLEAGGLTSNRTIQAKSRQAATLISATISGLAIVALSLIYVI